MALLALLIDLYSLIVFVWVILSWVRLSEDNPLVRITNAFVEPLVAPLRRVLPSFGGLDLSPMILLLVLRAARRLVVSV